MFVDQKTFSQILLNSVNSITFFRIHEMSLDFLRTFSLDSDMILFKTLPIMTLLITSINAALLI
jgi:hypothetical protein